MPPNLTQPTRVTDHEVYPVLAPYTVFSTTDHSTSYLLDLRLSTIKNINILPIYPFSSSLFDTTHPLPSLHLVIISVPILIY